ncbi:MAG: glycosyltransferase family 39 protein [Anaerolineae bacterium]
MPITTRRAWLLTVPVLLLLAFLLMRVLVNTQMYSDETLVYEFTRLDLPYTVTYLGEQDVHPPLWFSLFWAWRHLVGDSEFAGRMQACLFSLLTLAMTYRIGRDWFGRARYGWFALALLGTNAYFLTYALDIRPYALVMLLGSVSMWVFERWLRLGTRRLALAYAVVTALMFYVHYFSRFLVIAQMIYFLLRRPSRRMITQAAGVGLFALVLCTPWLPSFANQVGHLHQLAQSAGNAYGLWSRYTGNHRGDQRRNDLAGAGSDRRTAAALRAAAGTRRGAAVAQLALSAGAGLGAGSPDCRAGAEHGHGGLYAALCRLPVGRAGAGDRRGAGGAAAAGAPQSGAGGCGGA